VVLETEKNGTFIVKKFDKENETITVTSIA
jgi:hypothetical protein